MCHWYVYKEFPWKLVLVFWSFQTNLFAIALEVKFTVIKLEIADTFSVDHDIFNWW